MSVPDIRFVWLNVHGGAFHKLLRLHDRLLAAGLSCETLIAVGPPHGLKLGLDVPTARAEELAGRGVRLLPRAEVLKHADATPAELTVADAHHDADLPRLMAATRARGGKTAQMATLLGDFCHHGAEHLLLQHPLTLFFELDFNHTPESRTLAAAKGVHFTGNIFFEPTVNRLVNDYPDREAFCARYALDPDRPLCLWLPNSLDARSETYARVARAARQAGVNLLAKLHPWEYAFKKHGGAHPWGLSDASDRVWNVPAVDETDGAWAYRFCDLALVRASAAILELPFWEKPGALLPPTSYVRLVNAQARLVGRCFTHLPGRDEAAELAALFQNPPPAPTPADYAAARARVRLDTTRDAYAQTIDALRAILSAPDTLPGPGSLAALRRMADPFVGLDFIRALTPTRMVRYLAGRALRSVLP